MAGWRPAIGWICGAALAWQFVLSPILTYLIGICVAFGWIPKLPPLPVLDTSALYTVLLGMLGLGGMRTYEKINGVSRDTLDELSKTK